MINLTGNLIKVLIKQKIKERQEILDRVFMNFPQKKVIKKPCSTCLKVSMTI